jgi:hypothetical protein
MLIFFLPLVSRGREIKRERENVQKLFEMIIIKIIDGF